MDDPPIPLPKHNLNPRYVAIIANPSNNNEILLIGWGWVKSSIYIFNKKETTFVENKVDLTSLEKHNKKIEPSEILCVKAINSISNKDHIIILISYNYKLYYSIFDCKSYRLVYFKKNANYIDSFKVANSIKENDYQQLALHGDLRATIAVENYLIITGAGDDHRNIYMFDICDEMTPIYIHISNVTRKYWKHGCVKLPNIKKDDNGTKGKSIRLLLFGGYNCSLAKSLHELEITFKVLKKSATGRPGKNKTIRHKYTNSGGKDVAITIKGNNVKWKCQETSTRLSERLWYRCSYEWQNPWSNLILSLNDNNKQNKIASTKLSADNEKGNEGDDEKYDWDYKHKFENGRYLAVFDTTQIVIFDAHELEWYFPKYKTRTPWKAFDVNSCMDQGLLCVFTHNTLFRYYVGSPIDEFKIMISGMVDENNKLKNSFATSVFLDVFLSRDKNKFFHWKYICDEKLTDPVLLFHKFLTKKKVQALVVLWEMAQENTRTIPMISKWIGRDDLMKNVHLLLNHECWDANDINLLKMWVGTWHNENEFENGESGLLHTVCKYNNENLLKYLIDNNICNKNNYNIKNKETQQTCLDVAIINDSDECVNALAKKFGYESLTSRGVNGILKHDNHKVLEYIVKNDIYSLKGCIEVIVSNDCKYNATKCVDFLCNMMVSDRENIVTFGEVRDAILRDNDTQLQILLTVVLKRQGIVNIQCYRENPIITFEFIFNLLKLCINNGGGKKCSTLLKHWLHIINEYHCKSSAGNHDESQLQTNNGNNNPDSWICILCLKPISITIANNDTKKHEYDYCDCCDYLVCQNCQNVDDYQLKRV